MSGVTEVVRASRLRGSLRVPGDKSASHRALLLSALAEGESYITGLSSGADVAATSAIVCALGATRHDDDERVVIKGPAAGLRASGDALDCENSGTTMRLVAGVVSGVEGHHRLVGDASLSRRPMDRVAVPLHLMGAQVHGVGPSVTAPLDIVGRHELKALTYQVPVASAQVKSAILFAGLAASSATTVIERVRTRTTTEDMFQFAGVNLTSSSEGAGRRVTLEPSRPLARHWQIPGDPSQAAFFAVLGAIHDDASLAVLSVDASPERVGFVGVLARMGAQVALRERGDFTVLTTRSSALSATVIEAGEIPSLDEVPVITVAACAATGVSEFRAMGELRHKESDRFAASMALATSLGARVHSEGDDFFVEGLGSADAFSPFTLEAALDHRMVMAAAVAGAAGHGCTVLGSDTVASSYPHFFRDLALLS